MVQFAIVAAGFAVLAGHWYHEPNGRWATFLIGGYVYPLLVLTSLGSDLTPETARLADEFIDAGRIATVLLFLTVGTVTMLARRHPLRAPAALVLAYLTILAMTLSATVAGSGAAESARILLTASVVWNLFVIVPTIAGDNPTGWHEQLRTPAMMVAFTLILLSAVVVILFGSGTGSIRLSRPLSPGLLAWVASLALLLELLRPKPSLIVRVALFTAILLTASRTGLAGATMLLLLQTLEHRRIRARRLAALVLVGLLGLAVYITQVEPRLTDLRTPFERSTFVSGRDRLWNETTSLLSDTPMVGAGYQLVVESEHDDDVTRFHNMIIEVSLSYGIPAAMLAVLIYLSLLSGVSAYRSPHRTLLTGLTLLALGRTAVTTTSWLNLADGTNVLLLAILTPVAAQMRRRSELIAPLEDAHTVATHARATHWIWSPNVRQGPTPPDRISSPR